MTNQHSKDLRELLAKQAQNDCRATDNCPNYKRHDCFVCQACYFHADHDMSLLEAEGVGFLQENPQKSINNVDIKTFEFIPIRARSSPNKSEK